MRTSKNVFDPKELAKLHVGMKEGIRNVMGKKIVVLLGATGAGKSTSANALRGLPMKRVSDGLTTRYEVAESSVDKAAPIGHGGSATLFPAAYDICNALGLPSGRVFLDMAGLGDTRSKNISLCSSLALKEISEVAKIDGIAVVIRYEDIAKPRSKELLALFKLISQLTTQFCSEHLAFCITGADDALLVSKDSDAVAIAKILAHAEQAARAALAQVDPDDVLAKNELEQACVALSYMNAGNLFLMRELDNQEKQKTLQIAFSSYVEKMPGLHGGLHLAMDELTLTQLLHWSSLLAQAAVTQLTARKEIKTQCDVAEKKYEKIRLLHAQLVDAQAGLTKLADNFIHSDERKKWLESARKDLLEQKNTVSVVEQKFEVRLPEKNSGVTGLISYQFEQITGLHFERLEVMSPHIKIMSQDADKGMFTAALSYEITGEEKERYLSDGVKVFYRQENLPEYQDKMKNLTRELKALNARLPELLREKNKYEERCMRIRLDVQNAADNLGVIIHSVDSLERITVALEFRMAELQLELERLKLTAKEIEAVISPNKENYDLLYAVAKKAPLDLPDFMKLYNESYGEVVAEKNNVVSLRGPTSPVLFREIERSRMVENASKLQPQFN